MVGSNKLRSADEIRSFLQFTLVDSLWQGGTEEEFKQMEDRWRDKLTSWAPLGLNTRDD